MKRTLSILAALALSGTALAAPQAGQADGVVLTLNPDQPSYAPGQVVQFHVQGLPHTLTMLGIDVDPGPTMFPFGMMNLGFTSSFIILSGTSGDRGCYQWDCSHDCGDPALGIRFYLQAVQLPTSLPPMVSNPVSVIWEDLTGSCEREDLCLGGGVKPQVLTMQYTGEDCSATSHSQDPSKVFCNGDPAFAPLVHIIAHDPPNKNVWFEGDVMLGETFDLDATLAGATRLRGDTVVHIYDAMTGALLQSVGFHTSCSQPLYLGDQFGSLEVMGMVLEVR